MISHPCTAWLAMLSVLKNSRRRQTNYWEGELKLNRNLVCGGVGGRDDFPPLFPPLSSMFCLSLSLSLLYSVSLIYLSLSSVSLSLSSVSLCLYFNIYLFPPVILYSRFSLFLLLLFHISLIPFLFSLPLDYLLSLYVKLRLSSLFSCPARQCEKHQHGHKRKSKPTGLTSNCPHMFTLHSSLLWAAQNKTMFRLSSPYRLWSPKPTRAR